MNRKELLEKQEDIKEYRKSCEANLSLLYTEFGELFFQCDREVPEELETDAENIRKVLEVLKCAKEEEIAIQEELDKPQVYLCPNCNTQSVPGAKFCHECGAKLESEDGEALETVEDKELRECPYCGNILKPQTKFCGKCGTPVA